MVTGIHKVAVCSLFRDSGSTVETYFRRAQKITYPHGALTFICVEGDSKDNTWKLLQKEKSLRKDIVLKKFDTNKPALWGFINPVRMKALSDSANYAVRAAIRETDADYILWLESDLEYPPDIIERLMKRDKEIMAAMIFEKGTKKFYDVWAFRAGSDQELKGPEGAVGCFQRDFPYHPEFTPEHIFKVDSAGSVLLIKAEVIRKGAHFTDDEAIVGFCKTAAAIGYEVWVDPGTTIWHPTPRHGSLWGKIKYRPWHEGKVLSKLQEKVPIDYAAHKIGKKMKYGRALEYGWVAKRLRYEKGIRTLDLGCGDSEFPAYMATLGLDVYAVDKYDFLDIHKKYQKRFNVTYSFLKQDALYLDFPDGYFDQIVAVSSIEHEKNDLRLMEEVSRVCKSEGKILITLPYDHFAFWWDSGRPDGGQYYYDLQAIYERLVLPIKARVKDFSFIRYFMPLVFKKPYFTHPNNSGVMVIELENP